MKIVRTLLILAAVTLSACTSMRISGAVTDQQTGEPITDGGVVSGPRSAPCDFLGRYVIGVDRSWKTMQVIAPGYEPTTVTFEAAETRYPVYNVQLTPKPKKSRSEAGDHVPGAAPAR